MTEPEPGRMPSAADGPISNPLYVTLLPPEKMGPDPVEEIFAEVSEKNVSLFFGVIVFDVIYFPSRQNVVPVAFAEMADCKLVPDATETPEQDATRFSVERETVNIEAKMTVITNPGNVSLFIITLF